MVKRVGLILGAVGVSAVFLFVFLYWARPVAAQGLIIVNPGESIQAAIDGASDGDTILIMAGTYTESLTVNKPVSLAGVSSATTILHAEPNDRVLTVTGAMITEGVVISGLMVAGGDITGLSSGSNYGGGMALLSNAHPTFYNVAFIDNKAISGGGLWDEEDNLVLLINTLFISNTAVEDFGAVNMGTVVIIGGRFENNHCIDLLGCYGGAIGAENLTIDGARILSNSATSLGGAIFAGNFTATNSLFAYNICSGQPSCQGGVGHIYESVVVSNSMFLSNQAHQVGGLATFSTTLIINSQFIDNRCTDPGCSVGGLWVLRDAVISGTSFLNNSADGFGGGLLASNNVKIFNNIFSGNSANTGGGAIVNETAWVDDTLFEKNEGGGIFSFGTVRTSNSVYTGNFGNEGGGIWASYLHMTETQVVSNTATSDGGGVYIDESGVVADSYFANNQAIGINRTGGGIHIASSVSGSLNVSNSIFHNNFAPTGGGGIYGYSPVNVHQTIFTGNSCTMEDCFGGGLGVFSPLTLTQSVFVGNVAVDGQGGAVYAWQPNMPFNGGGVTNTALVVNNLFAENTAGFREGTIHFENGVVEVVHNTIVASDADNDAGIYFYNSVASLTNTIVTSYSEAVRVGPFSFVSEDYNLFYDNFTIFSGEVSSGGHSIYDGDPDFVDPMVGDYHIGFGSAGLDNALDLGILIDLDGNPRPIGAGPDRGAYEAGIPEPIAGLMAANSSPTIVGNVTLLTATITSGNGVAYDWDFGDGTQGSGAAVSHAYPGVGVYTAVVTASNSLNMMTATTVVSVVDEAIGGLVVSSNSPVQLGEAVVLTATISAGTNVSYSWDFGDGASGVGQVVSHTYALAGSYTVTVTATNSVGQMVVTAVVVVLEEPKWSVYLPVVMRP